MTTLTTLALPPALFAPHPGSYVGNQTARTCPGVRASRCAQADNWPPTIRSHNVGGLEGLSRRNGFYQRFARYGRIEAYAFAFFGRAHPTASELAATNAALAAVRLHQ